MQRRRPELGGRRIATRGGAGRRLRRLPRGSLLLQPGEFGSRPPSSTRATPTTTPSGPSTSGCGGSGTEPGLVRMPGDWSHCTGVATLVHDRALRSPTREETTCSATTPLAHPPRDRHRQPRPGHEPGRHHRRARPTTSAACLGASMDGREDPRAGRGLGDALRGLGNDFWPTSATARPSTWATAIATCATTRSSPTSLAPRGPPARQVGALLPDLRPPLPPVSRHGRPDPRDRRVPGRLARHVAVVLRPAGIVGIDIDERPQGCAGPADTSSRSATRPIRSSCARVADQHGPVRHRDRRRWPRDGRSRSSPPRRCSRCSPTAGCTWSRTATRPTGSLSGRAGPPGTFIEWAKERIDDLHAYHQPGPSTRCGPTTSTASTATTRSSCSTSAALRAVRGAGRPCRVPHVSARDRPA